MDVYDSNIWVLGLTGEVAAAETLVAEAASADRFVSVTPYIYSEVYEAFKREFKGEKAMAHVTDFSTLIAHSETVDAPSQSAISAVELSEVRNRDENILLSGVLGCQIKDVPIIVAAFQRYKDSGDNVTIYTADKDFADTDLQALDISALSLEYVEY